MRKGLNETAKYWIVCGVLSLIILILVASAGNKRRIEIELVNYTGNIMTVVSESGDGFKIAAARAMVVSPGENVQLVNRDTKKLHVTCRWSREGVAKMNRFAFSSSQTKPVCIWDGEFESGKSTPMVSNDRY